MNIYNQNFEFLMFDDAVEASVIQAGIISSLSIIPDYLSFMRKLENNPFFDLDRVHEKERQDDYIRKTPEIQRICDAFHHAFRNQN